MKKNVLNKNQKKEILDSVKGKADKVVTFSILFLFVFGIVLSFWYDTYEIAFLVGGLNLILYFSSKYFFKDSNLYQYIAGIVFPLFMAQFIYQMHGLFEMHFFAFLGSVVLIGYQKWQLQIPLVVTIAIHHSTFAYLQYSGVENVYFTQFDYMDLETFIFHVLVAVIVISYCAFWGYDLGNRLLASGVTNLELKKQMEIVKENKRIAEQISNGNLDTTFELENTEKDELATSLMQMQDSLKEASANEAKEKFQNIGLNKLADLFQKHSRNPQEYYDEALTFIVKYLKLMQGAIFVVDNQDENTVIELRATYAYDRKKYLNMSIKPGEGLVGQCYLEKEMIYLTDIPQGFLKIKSGLGESTPGCVAIIPMKNNDEILGVIELNRFEPLDENEMSFIQKIGESMGASTNTIKNSEETNKLLEMSQEQQEMMQQQEEEMKQNIEEMNASQEEMQRREEQLEGQLEAINESTAYIEFEPDGTILDANKLFCSATGYSLNEIQGKHHRIFCFPEYTNSDEYGRFWSDLAKGISKNGEIKRKHKSGKVLWLAASYNVVKNKNGEVVKVIKLAKDITASKMAALEFENQMTAINQSFAVIEFDLKGNILKANDVFCGAMECEEKDIVGKHHEIFVPEPYKSSDEYKKFWKDIGAGESVFGEFDRITCNGNPIRIKGSYSVIKDDTGKPYKAVKYVVAL